MRLEECLTSHKSCQQHDAPALPDRVIDVENGGEICQLFHPEGMRAQYTALSHCWGGQVEFKLEEKTLAAFCKGLPISKLAKSFQDAIKITRSLGIRYLWVDCLCIIQDSTTDWLEQSKKMASVYSHATLTIYATTSPISRHGILTPTNSSMIKEMPFTQPVYVSAYKASAPTDSEAQLELVHAEEDDMEEEPVDLAMHSVLASRGWTLQEYVLAPRRLLFGKKRVHWECLHGTQTMDGFTFTDWRYSIFEFYTFRSQIHPPSELGRSRGQRILDDYYGLVELYGDRQLTKSSDKLPAFSAIARSAHGAIKGEYIAGIWTEDLHKGLLWYCDTPRRHQHLPTSYRAPSWSWAKTNHKVKSFYGRYAYKTLPLHESWRISLVDDTNPFGEIQSAQLNVTVWTKRLQFVPFDYPSPPQGFPLSDHSWHPGFDVLDNSVEDPRKGFINQGESEFYGIFAKGTENWEPKDYLLMAVMEHGTGRSDRPRLVCLAIGRPSNAMSEAYERVGVLEMPVSRDWQESWPRQSITLV